MGFFDRFKQSPKVKATRTIYRHTQHCVKLADSDSLGLADVNRLYELLSEARALGLSPDEIESVVVQAARAARPTSVGKGLIAGVILRHRGAPAPHGVDQARQQMEAAHSLAAELFGEDAAE